MTKTIAEILEAHEFHQSESACTCEEMYYDTRLELDQILHEHILHQEMQIHNAGYEHEVVTIERASRAAFRDKGIQGLQRVLIGNWLRNRLPHG